MSIAVHGAAGDAEPGEPAGAQLSIAAEPETVPVGASIRGTARVPGRPVGKQGSVAGDGVGVDGGSGSSLYGRIRDAEGDGVPGPR
jgi:hypothetical protein